MKIPFTKPVSLKVSQSEKILLVPFLESLGYEYALYNKEEKIKNERYNYLWLNGKDGGANIDGKYVFAIHKGVGCSDYKIEIKSLESFLAYFKEEEPIEINGYTAQFGENSVKFGCAEIDNSVFNELNSLIHRNEGLNSNRSVESVKIGNGEFSAEIIEKIANRINNG